ncbi:hypothetical protein pb186bvf_004023 [Paramecium bursaria]
MKSIRDRIRDRQFAAYIDYQISLNRKFQSPRPKQLQKPRVKSLYTSDGETDTYLLPVLKTNQYIQNFPSQNEIKIFKQAKKLPLNKLDQDQELTTKLMKSQKQTERFLRTERRNSKNPQKINQNENSFIRGWSRQRTLDSPQQ